MLKTIYVSIGFPWARSAFVKMCMCNVQLETQTPIQVAKLLRKQTAETMEIEDTKNGRNNIRRANPSEMYYAIFESYGDSNPIAYSNNYPGEIT